MRRFAPLLHRATVSASLVFWLTSTVSADPIVLSVTRAVTGSAEVEGNGSDFSSFAEFSFKTGLFEASFRDTVSIPGGDASFDVAQTTIINGNHWSGFGRAEAHARGADLGDHEFVFAGAESESKLESVFRLSEPTFFRFSGLLRNEMDNEDSATSSLIGFVGENISLIRDSPGEFAFGGVLPPNEYRFFAEASSTGIGSPFQSTGGTAEFQFQLGFGDAAVPEPASLLLFGTGATAIGRSAWRRRRRARGQERRGTLQMRLVRTIGVLLFAWGVSASAWADPFLFGFTNNHEVVSLITNQGTFLTSAAQFDDGTNNSGWWSATKVNETTKNDNYTVGNHDGHLFNDFFTFSIPVDLGTVTSASLSLPRGESGNTAGVPFSYSLFDVTTSAAVLNNNTGTNAAIFNDLGSGVLYSSIFVTDLTSPNPLVVTLNSSLLAALNAGRGGYFSIGGTLTQTPEPATLTLLAIGSVGMIRRIRRQKSKDAFDVLV
jgi:hypothetical protein